MKPILVLGDLSMQVSLGELTGHPRRGREVLAATARISPGGTGALVAAALTKLGRKASLVAKIGDRLPDQVQKAFDTSTIVRDPRQKTGLSVVFSDDARVTYPGAAMSLGPKDLRKIKLARYAHLHIASPYHLLGLPLKPLIRKARAAGLTVSMSGGTSPRRGVELGSLDLDVLFTDGPEAGGALVTVVRKGSRGALAYTAGKRWKAAGLAAGPVFDAAFLDGWLDGHRVHEVLAYAIAAGSLSADRGGGFGSAPTRSEALDRAGRIT